jgi:hypothetical protein
MPSYLGKGTIYVEETGGGKGLLSIGNCSELNLAFNEDKKEQKDFEEAGGAVVDTVSRIDSVVASITALNLSASNIALALRGLVNTVVGGAVVDEPHVGDVGAFIPFDLLPDMSVAPVITGAAGTPVFVAGTDYEVKNGGIVAIAGAGITAALPLQVSYTSAASFDIEGLATAGLEYKVVFDGLNEADSGKPVLVTCHRVKFNPTQALALISEDFGDLALSFDVLKDTSIIGATKSKFVKIQVNQ